MKQISVQIKVKRFIFISIICLFFIFLNSCEPKGTSYDADASLKQDNYQKATLADFEDGIPCSDQGDSIGFRKRDKSRGETVSDGADGTEKSAVFKMGPENIDIYFQGSVRRRYLVTRSEKYVNNGPNTLSFWVKIPQDSPLIGKVEYIKLGDKIIGKKLNEKSTFGILSYHWRQGDIGVGGWSNMGLTTDSNMHGYSEFRFNEKAGRKWVRIVLSPSAFRMTRNYYHFYAARGTTDDLEFFSSLRQLQFRILAKLEKEEDFQIDEIKLIYQSPTVIFEKDFYNDTVSKNIGDFSIPVTIKNPTNNNRSYRVFISSFLGAERELLNKVFALTDDMAPMREIQSAVNGDGGIGVVELVSDEGVSVTMSKKEIIITAGGVWKGKLVHHIKPEMLSKKVVVKTRGYEFEVRRDTLTTSVIVWDPEDSVNKEMDYIEVSPHNSDDGNHPAPAGFPRQKRPPEGWRSEDVPINQVGGYFVSLIRLTD